MISDNIADILKEKLLHPYDYVVLYGAELYDFVKENCRHIDQHIVVTRNIQDLENLSGSVPNAKVTQSSMTNTERAILSFSLAFKE